MFKKAITKKMFHYSGNDSENVRLYSANEVIHQIEESDPESFSSEVLKVLNHCRKRNNTQVIYGMNLDLNEELRIVLSEREEVEVNADCCELEEILEYIQQIELYSDTECEDLDKLFNAPNLEVISFEPIVYNEHVGLLDGINVVFGDHYNGETEILSKLPAMSMVTFTENLDSEYQLGLIRALDKWCSLEYVHFFNNKLTESELSELRRIVVKNGLETNCRELKTISLLNKRLRNTNIWTVLSSNKLVPDLLRILVEMLYRLK